VQFSLQPRRNESENRAQKPNRGKCLITAGYIYSSEKEVK
jgi:hypothetical protein